MSLITVASEIVSQDPNNHDWPMEQDQSDPYDNEVVADSEEEDSYLFHGRPIVVESGTTNSVSSIQTPALPTVSSKNICSLQTTAPSGVSDFTDKQPDKLETSITSFTSVAVDKEVSSSSTKIVDSISNTGSDSVPRDRPRPRPIYKVKDKSREADNSSSIEPSRFNGLNKKTNSDPFPHIQMDTSSSTSNITERANVHLGSTTKSAMSDPISKVTASTSSKPKRNSKSTALSSEVIELSSDDDELVLRPPLQTKTKGKSKPISKVPSGGHKVSPIKHKKTPHHPTPPNSTRRASLPAATSPTLPSHFLPSDLPPSDPYPPTSDFDHPPIAILPNTDSSSDHNVRSSSPLFSPVKVRPSARKRKRPQPVDELDSNDTDAAVGEDSDIRKMLPPPVPSLLAPAPPTFFASSSLPLNIEESPRVEAEANELSALISSASANVSSDKASKVKASKKPRKNKDDAANASSKKKPVPKKQQKDGKRKKDTIVSDQMEVVVEVPARTTKSKSKGKEKEVFKSREFIDDDDEDEDHEVVRPLIVASDRETEEMSEPKMTSVTYVHDSVVETPASRKKRKVVGNLESGEESIGIPKKKQKDKEKRDGDGQEDVRKKLQKKSAAKGKGKVIVSEDEGSDDSGTAGEDNVTVTPRRKTGRRKMDKNGEGKPNEKNKPLDDENTRQGVKESSDHGGIQKHGEESEEATKENPGGSTNTNVDVRTTPKESSFPNLSSRYTIAPRTKSAPLSELIRRVNSLPGSNFSTPHSRTSTPKLQSTAYSPYLKSSRSLLSRIAPLHPNRRTPPPPLPPPPPPKKNKEGERKGGEVGGRVGGECWRCY